MTAMYVQLDHYSRPDDMISVEVGEPYEVWLRCEKLSGGEPGEPTLTPSEARALAALLVHAAAEAER